MNEQSFKKIFCIGAVGRYDNWMDGVQCWKMVEADLVLFTGGEDVTPSLYGARANATTGCNPERDRVEIEAFRSAMKLDKKMIGICRGAQFLSVMAGGKLIQNMNHPNQHRVQTYDDKVITVTSTHHQMQYPWEMDEKSVKVLAWADSLSEYHWGEDGEALKGIVEVEMAYYPKIKALCIQSHPEYVWPASAQWEKDYLGFCKMLLAKHMKGDL